MKIALVTDDERTISQHFGRAEKYIVFSVEDGNIKDRETRAKLGNCHSQGGGDHGHHHHEPDPRGSGFGHQAASRHAQMFEAIKDCEVLVSRGMGRGAYLGLQEIKVRPVVTEIADIEQAVLAVIDGTIVDHTEKLH